MIVRLLALCFALAAALPAAVRAEDGYDLWLRHAPLEGEALERIDALPLTASVSGTDQTILLAASELLDGVTHLRGNGDEIPLMLVGGGGQQERAATFDLSCNTAEVARGGAYVVRASNGGIDIRAGEPVGCLYGAYALLRELSLGADPRTLNITSAPAMPLRMIDHWDNPNGHVERGYAGDSIFDWWRLPERLDQRMIDYARAEASIGINAVAVNNVSARDNYFVESRNIPKLARLADAWRPYGIRIYVAIRFSAPVEIGGLDTADPADPRVQAWWRAKADEFYAAIPDFGGFLVKANSEGQPGPRDYGRTQAEGANMFAAALGGRGTVIWRAFVYSAEDQTDRAMQAYNEFVPLDGQFADNVIVQIKNGPIDFQPREPFHPLFGAMPHTRVMLEAQITKEYLGQATHLAYLAPMWEEALHADTGRGGTVAQVIAPVGMAGVANTGMDRNWSGSDFDQANWYAFGRLAWDPGLTSAQIAREWAALTFSRDPQFVDAVAGMMLGSRQAVVDYMTPLGLAHQMATGHHYGPGPWVCDLARPEWNPCYYARADAGGIGFDRTATGSNALAQYAPAVAASLAADPDYLLWFHHLGWDHAMPSGQRLWPELVGRYDRGVAAVDAMVQTWEAQEPYVDPQRFRAVAENLAIQQREARWWRDASLAYWQSVNGLPLPAGSAPPAHDLAYYRALAFPEAPGQ